MLNRTTTVRANVAFSVCLVLGAAFAAAGQSRRENLKKCGSSDPDTMIAGCTALIQSGRESTASLAGAYNRRGGSYILKADYDHAIQDYNDAIRLNPNDANGYGGRATGYYGKGDYDRAIQDCDEAIRLNGHLATAYMNRAVVYVAKGDYNSAIRDYDNAIRLNSKDAFAYYNRGNAYSEMGDYNRAIQDLNQAIHLNPKFAEAYENRGDAYLFQSNLIAAIADYKQVISASPSSEIAVYATLMLHIAMKRQGSDDAQQLAIAAAIATPSKWPAPLLQLDLGQISSDNVLAAAANSDPDTQKRQICEANYFTGEDALLHNQTAQAMARFKVARDSCTKGHVGYAEALAELRRLGAQDSQAR